MALPLNIDDLIHQRKVESARIEYKKDWNPEKVLHSVCAFANDIDNWGGGYIILGVEEKNGMPVLPPYGIRKESVDAVNKELLNVCNLIEGRYVPVVSHEVYEGADILVLWCPFRRAALPHKRKTRTHRPERRNCQIDRNLPPRERGGPYLPQRRRAEPLRPHGLASRRPRTERPHAMPTRTGLRNAL